MQKKYLNQTPRLTQPPNASGTQGSNIPSAVIERTEVAKTKRTGREDEGRVVKEVCEQPPGAADPKARS